MRDKRLLYLCFFLSIPLFLFSENSSYQEDFSSLKNWHIVNGNWKIDSGKRLIQTDTKVNITHIYTKVEQSGELFYEFEVGYVGGLEDEYGGFGCHILIDKPTTSRSWGHGKSFLFWFTYDKYAYGSRQFFFQIYKSSGSFTMTMIHEARKYPVPVEYLSPREFMADKAFARPVKIRFSIDTHSGKGKLFFSRGEQDGFHEFDIKDVLPEGHYFSFRTNHMAVLLDNLTITSGTFAADAAMILLDASLSGLAVSRGVLNPLFSGEITDYRLAVDHAVSDISITPAAAGMIAVNDEIVLSRKASDNIPLREGENRVIILVTAANAAATRQYTITIMRDRMAEESFTENPFPANSLLFSTIGK